MRAAFCEENAISTWQWILVGIGVLALLPVVWLLDRLGLWLEERGWLFYRKRKPSSSPLSSLVALQQFIEPGVQHVVQAGRQRRVDDEQGAAHDRLLNCIQAILVEPTPNPEAIRLYLAQAHKEGLDWQALYAEAIRGLPEDAAPAPEKVSPIE
jgi:hypothetical protein